MSAMKRLFQVMADKKASDIFISVGAPINIKINGVAIPVNQTVMTAETVQQLLYEVLTGKKPFKGENLSLILDQVLWSEPERPSLARPGVPADLEAICRKCLRKEPRRRYASAVELADDLHRYWHVNGLFADAAVAEAGSESPVVLVQDYHFAFAPRIIRERLPRATTVTFWHIP